MRNITQHAMIGMMFLSGCATAPSGGPASTDKAALSSMPEGAVDISYLLGHSKHRLRIEAEGSHGIARSYRDGQVVEETRVDAAKYSEFHDKAVAFVKAPKRTPATNPEGCRTPYIVTVVSGGQTTALNGCRGSDDRGFGRLVRDGEFLMYSKK